MKILFVLACIAFCGCVSTSTAGLTKDQIKSREETRSGWSAFGLGAAKVVGQIAIGWLGAQAGAEQGQRSLNGFSK